MPRTSWRRRTVAALALLGGLVSFCLPAHAQLHSPFIWSTGALSGVVRDRSGRPVANASISLRDASPLAGAPNSGRTAGVLTDDNGHFAIPKIPGGEFTLTVLASGFIQYTASITIRADKPNEHDIVLDSIFPR